MRKRLWSGQWCVDFGFDKERESEREIRVDGGEEVAVVKR